MIISHFNPIFNKMISYQIAKELEYLYSFFFNSKIQGIPIHQTFIKVFTYHLLIGESMIQI